MAEEKSKNLLLVNDTVVKIYILSLVYKLTPSFVGFFSSWKSRLILRILW